METADQVMHIGPHEVCIEFADALKLQPCFRSRANTLQLKQRSKPMMTSTVPALALRLHAT
jgi:hypothetical protein